MSQELFVLDELLRRRLKQRDEATKKPKDSSLTEILDIREFEARLKNNSLSDSMATAQLMVGGIVNQNYNIYIDRRTITRNDGAIISFNGILKQFSLDQIAIVITYKPIKLRRSLRRGKK